MALKDIEAFLAQEIHEGQFDSHGSFSVDESRSLDKLARYQSERPGLWLVKLLQAATALGCHEFDVKQQLGQTLVRFHPRQDSLAGLTHLQVALQAASTLPGCSFSLRQGEDQPWEVKRGAPRPPLVPPEKRSIEITRHWSGFTFSPLEHVRRARLQRDEALLLQELCRYAPLAVRLDRRLLNDPVINKPPGLRLGVYVPPFAGRPRPAIPYTAVERIVLSSDPLPARMALMDHSLRRPLFLQRNQQHEHIQGRNLYLQQWVGAGWLDQELWAGILRRETPGYSSFDSRIERSDGEVEIWSDYNRDLGAICVKGYLSLDINRGRAGRLYLVRDGVLMKPKTLPDELAEVLILWSAPHLNTDLTQLQVVEDEVYVAELRTIFEHLRAAADSLLRVAAQSDHRVQAQQVLNYLENSRLPSA